MPESEWLGVVEEVLLGMNHALNNRAASMWAFVELARLGGAEAVTGNSAAVLAGDVQRVMDCGRVAQLIAENRDTREVALTIADVLEDAMTIHRFIHETRDIPVTVALDDATAPVRVIRWKLLRGLTMVLLEAKRAMAPDGTLHVSVRSSDALVRVVVSGMSANGVAPSGRRYADLLIESVGGTVSRADVAIEVRLPSLSSRRAMDRQ